MSEGGSVKVVRTGYTVRVETDRRRYFFADKDTPPHVFATSKAIERDIERSGVIVDNIDLSAIKYFRFPEERRMPERAWNVDIRAAYPTTLRNNGMIGSDTFDRCLRLAKPDRLKSVGMIAGRRFVQEFSDRRLISSTIETNPYRPYFFAACRIVGDVMESVAEFDERALLFYWVDGLFLRTDDPAPFVDIVRSFGYEAKAEPVEALKRSTSGRYMFYRKGGKRTYLCIPQRIEYEDADLIRTLGECSSIG